VRKKAAKIVYAKCKQRMSSARDFAMLPQYRKWNSDCVILFFKDGLFTFVIKSLRDWVKI
jgi:hypothetical protein